MTPFSTRRCEQEVSECFLTTVSTSAEVVFKGNSECGGTINEILSQKGGKPPQKSRVCMWKVLSSICSMEKKKGSLCFTFTLQSPGLLEVLLGSCPSIPRMGQHAFHISMLNALCMSVYGWLWIWPITAQTLEERWLFFKRPHGSLPSAGIWKRRGHQRW